MKEFPETALTIILISLVVVLLSIKELLPVEVVSGRRT